MGLSQIKRYYVYLGEVLMRGSEVSTSVAKWSEV